MRYLTYLPLTAAALAVGVLLCAPDPMEAGRTRENNYQGQVHDRGDGGSTFYESGRGVRRNLVTGFWWPYR